MLRPRRELRAIDRPETAGVLVVLLVGGKLAREIPLVVEHRNRVHNLEVRNPNPRLLAAVTVHESLLVAGDGRNVPVIVGRRTHEITESVEVRDTDAANGRDEAVHDHFLSV